MKRTLLMSTALAAVIGVSGVSTVTPVMAQDSNTKVEASASTSDTAIQEAKDAIEEAQKKLDEAKSGTDDEAIKKAEKALEEAKKQLSEAEAGMKDQQNADATKDGNGEMKAEDTTKPADGSSTDASASADASGSSDTNGSMKTDETKSADSGDMKTDETKSADSGDMKTDETKSAENGDMKKTDQQAADNGTMTNDQNAKPADQTDTAAATAGQGDIFFVYEQDNQIRSDKLIGHNVTNPDGENVGDINQLIVSRDGNFEGVIIGVGGFLGIGEKNVGVRFDALNISEDPESDDLVITMDQTKDALEQAPAFVTKESQKQADNMAQQKQEQQDASSTSSIGNDGSSAAGTQTMDNGDAQKKPEGDQSKSQ